MWKMFGMYQGHLTFTAKAETPERSVDCTTLQDGKITQEW